MRTRLRSKSTLLFVAFAALLLSVAGTTMALTADPSGTTATSGATAPAPTIQSDKEDYPPGGLVTLTGSNWQPGESVNIKVNDTYGASWARNVDVTADANGNVTDSFNLPDWFVSDYDVTATGAQSGTVRTTFTDSNPQTLVVTPASQTVIQGQSTLYSATVTIGGNSDQCTTTLSASGLPTGATASFSGPNPRTGNSSYTSGMLVSTTNATPTGSHTLTVQMTRGANCQGNGNLTQQVTLVVNSGNQAPAIARNNATVTVNEGQTATNTGTWSDANAGDTVTLSASVGTVTKSGTNASGTWSWSLGTADGPEQGQTVTITANDGKGGTTSTTFALTVNNVAPTVTLSGPATAEEGTTKHYTYTVSDPGADTFTVSSGYPTCGTGGNVVTGSAATTATGGSFDCTFPDGPATTNVAIKVADSDGASDTASESVQIVAVANVAPTVTLSGTAAANEGDTKTYTYTVSDPGDDSNPTITEDCGANGTKTDTAASNSFDCTFPDGPASSTVKVSANDGTDEGSDSIAVTVSNVKPSVALSGAATADEGDTKTYTYTVTDPGDDTYTAAEDCGANGTKTDTATADSFECTFPDGPASSTVKVTADDGDTVDNTGTDSIDVTVANVKPSVVLNGDATADEGQTKTYTYTVTDPGNDTYTAAEDCGANGTKTDTPAADSFDCTFPDGPATTDVTVKVTDSDGAADTDNQLVTVTVSNVAPTVTLSGDAAANEGDTKTYTYTVSDPGDDSNPTITEDCGANGTKTDTAASNSFDCTFPDGPASSTVKVTADDGDTVDNTGTDSIDVTVANVKPSVVLNGDATADEGQTKTYTYTVTDPGNDTYTAAEDCGANGTKTDTATADSFDCTFPDGPATTDVTVKVTDSDGATDTDNQLVTVTVSNVAPVVELTGSATANEGDTKTYTYTVSDPGDDSNPTITEDCGANGTKTDTAASNSFDCTFPDGPANPTVKVSANDGTDEGSDSIDVAVSNVKPSVVLSGPATADEGDTKTYTYTVTDPGNDTYTAQEDCGANGTKTDTPAADSFDCTFPDGPATTDVTVKVTDSDGAADTDNQLVTVTVSNVAPVVELTGSATADEGQTKTYTYTVSDPGDDSNPTITEDCGTGGTKTDTAASNSFDCTFPDGPANPTVKVTANDGTDEGSDSIGVAVSNVKPTIGPLTVTGSGAACIGSNNVVTLSFSITDPGVDTHSGTIKWGDGTTTQFTGSSVTQQHSYSAGGYTITVDASDSDGGTATKTTTPGQVSLLYKVSELQDPVNRTGMTMSVFKYGSTVPLKVLITDCNNQPVNGLVPRISFTKVNPATPAIGVNEGLSTQPNDTNFLMRDAGNGQYIYNLSTKSLADGDATYNATITDSKTPATYGPKVSQNFGLRSK